MNDYIRRAFKSLEDLQVVIEPVTKSLREDLEIETEVEEEPETIRDLFDSEMSYIITHDFEDEGLAYSLFLEALNDGESCDIEFEEFDINNITEVLVEILDSEHDFLGSLSGEDITLETPLEEVIGKAKAFINGEEELPVEEPEAEVSVEAEEKDANEREFISDKVEVKETDEELLNEKPLKESFIIWWMEQLRKEGICYDIKSSKFIHCEDGTEVSDEEMKAVEKKLGQQLPQEESLKEDDVESTDSDTDYDGVFIKYADFNSLDGAEERFDSVNDAIEYGKAHPEFKPLVVYTVINDEDEVVHRFEGSLTESKSFDLLDEDEVKEAEKDIEELKNETTNDEIMQIVDASAESTDELRDSYIGGMVLQCPVCKATMFKDMDQLVKEEDGDLYNVEEECPHCGSKGGFDLIGQLAKPDVNPFGEPEEPKAEDEEIKVEDEVEEEEPEAEPLPQLETPAEDEEFVELDLGSEPKHESLNKTCDVILESLDETKFDRLVIKYLKETYTNIKSYKTLDAGVDDNSNKLIIEGLITFNSGKEKKTTFTFEAKEMTNKKQLKLIGINETFAPGKAFTLLAGTDNGKLLSESLAYRYTIDDKKVKGKAQAFQKR